MSERRFETDAIHAGGPVDTRHALATPIVRSAPFVFPTIEELDQLAAGKLARYEYSRSGHPTARAAEERIAALEGADDTIVLSSGMAAVSTTYLALLDAGDHVLVTDDGYKRTLTFARDILPRFGITGELIDSRDAVAAAQAAWRPETKLVLAESPTNPHLRLVDIPALAALCRARDARLVIDSTIASPYNLRPLALGADLAIHSATKFLAGHNDVLCGAISGERELIAKIRDFHTNLGAVLDPEGCYLLLRGMKTLAVRVERENASALQLAQWLEAQPRVKAVHYPGLPSHPQHALAQRDLRGFGGMLSFELDADLAAQARDHLARHPQARVLQASAHAVETWRGASRIYAGFAVERMPQAWLDALPEGGVLVAPVGTATDQRLMRYQRHADRIESEALGAVRYVPDRASPAAISE